MFGPNHHLIDIAPTMVKMDFYRVDFEYAVAWCHDTVEPFMILAIKGSQYKVTC